MALINLILPRLDCKICFYTWHPRQEELPMRCPNCHNTGWQVGRTRKAPVKRAAKGLGGEL